jgi:hypothetical protein
MRRKILSVTLLMGALLWAVLTACQSGGGDNAETLDASKTNGESAIENDGNGESATEESYYDKLGERDFGGDSFVILHDGDREDIFYSGEELTGEPIKDASFMRDGLIGEKYNVKIEYIYTDYNRLPSLLKNSVATGEHLYDMVISSVITMSSPAQNNFMYNIASMPHLSLDCPWWSKLIFENLTFDGKLFYTAGDIFPGMYMAPSATYVNKKLLQDHGITDNLYELVFSGKWTFDVLERLTKDLDMDLNQDGKMHDVDDFFGFISQNHTLSANTFCAAMGIKLSTIRDNAITVNLTSQSTIEKIDKLASFLKPITYSDTNDLITNTFHDGKAIFLTHYLESAFLYLRTMDDDYGILPMPKYDEAQQSYINALNPWNASSIGVPLLVDPDKVGFLMEVMGYMSYESIRPNVYELTLKTKFARDAESMGVIDMIIETSYLDLNMVYNFGGSTDIVRDAIFSKKPLVSAYEKAEPKIQKAIEQYIANISAE